MRIMKAFVALALVAMPLSSVLAQEATDTPSMAQMGAWEACADPASLSGPINIGLAFALSEGASIYGTPQLQAAEIAVAEINESGYLGEAELVGVSEDALSSPEGAIAAFTNLVEEEGVVAIVGPTLSNQAMAADPVALEAGIPVLGVSNTRGNMEADLGEGFFRISLPEDKVIPGTVAQAVEILGLESVAVMHSDNDQFTVSGYEVFVSELEANGVEIAAEETFQTGDVDFNAQLTNIVGEELDAIVVSALAAEIVPLLQQARDQGYTGPIIGGNGFNTPGIANEDRAGAAANGVIVGGAWNAARQNELSMAFSTKFEEANGTPADQFAVQAYSGVWLLATAIRCADSADPAAITEAMGQISDFETPLGTFSFDENGVPQHEPVAQIIVDGKYELLTEETAAQVFGE